MYVCGHQIYALLHRFGIPTPAYHLIKKSNKESFLCQTHLGQAFVKAHFIEETETQQTTSKEEAAAVVEELFSQSPSPMEVLVIPHIPLKSRYYLAVSIERGEIVVTASVDDDLSLKERERERRLFRETVSERGKLHNFQVRRLLAHLGVTKNREGMRKIIEGLLSTFLYFDATFIEIAPLGCSEGGKFLALDVRMDVDGNALFRQPEVARLVTKARENKLLGGTIGCMANGKGLAAATCDLVRLVGKSSAIALDVENSVEAIVQGLHTLENEKSVEKIFINVFMGLLDCEKIVDALRKQKISKPTVIRIEGTNAKRACALLKKLPPTVLATTSLKAAAQAVREL